LTKNEYLSRIAKINILKAKKPVGNHLLKRAMNWCKYGSKCYWNSLL